MKTYSALDIAQEFVKIADENGEHLSHMKLQKLVYFAHGWHLGLTNKPLLDETIEAWQYGPVIPSLYEEYKKYGSRPIIPNAVMRNQKILPQDVKDLIQKIWNVYGGFTASQLSTLTHEEGSPWDLATAEYAGSLPKGLDVPNDIIAKHFEAQKVPVNG